MRVEVALPSPLLLVDNLRKRFPMHGGLLNRQIATHDDGGAHRYVPRTCWFVKSPPFMD